MIHKKDHFAPARKHTHTLCTYQEIENNRKNVQRADGNIPITYSRHVRVTFASKSATLLFVFARPPIYGQTLFS